MKPTYRAMQVVASGTLQSVERRTPEPGDAEMLIAVEACGICGADAADIARADPKVGRVPGHEVVGRIAAMGTGTPSMWKVGQRVGVGRLGGHCNECDDCRQGLFETCRNQPVVGVSCDGGYAEMMLARATGLVSIPSELSSVEAAPILCAGIATFNALKKSGAEAGDLIAVQGIGGLGHMAIQYAKRMGFKVAAIGRGADIADDAKRLGAHIYIDANAENAAATLTSMGGAKAIVTTIGNAAAVSSLAGGLAAHGRLVLLGAPREPLHLMAGAFVGGQRSVLGSITGSPYESERALAFSVLADIRPMIETMPLDRAAEAFERMKSGDVKFRMVLTMGGSQRAS